MESQLRDDINEAGDADDDDDEVTTRAFDKFSME